MSKSNKITDAYIMGMEFALKIAKEQGVSYLESEVRSRSKYDLPLNVSRGELIATAREYMQVELDSISTAICWTVTKELKLPPSMVYKFLTAFNERIDVYREDKELMGKDQKLLDRDGALQAVCKKFNDYRKEAQANGEYRIKQ